VKATVSMRYPDLSIARSIEAALKADNRAAPKPLYVRSRVSGRRVISSITGAQDIESLLTTIDDLLLCLIAVDGFIMSPKRKRTKARARR
jgi:hypothetical protein